VETIIQQICMEMAKKICRRVEEGGMSNIDQFATDALEHCKESVREIIRQIVKELNDGLRADKAYRKEQGLIMKEKERERCLLTEIGPITIRRDYYLSKSGNKYICPIDSMLGLTAYERVSANLSARMVGQAAEVSYEKSARIESSGKVSKQTVKNKLLAVGRLEKEMPKERRTVPELHIFADEDHAHLQNGKSRDVPLITVSEGVKEVCLGRNALVNPVHFSSAIRETGKTWEIVAGYIEQAYEENRIDKIYLHGDGASWIKKGLEVLPKSLFVIDGFHLEKRLKSVTAAFSKQNYHFRIRQAIFEKDKEKVLSLIKEMLSKTDNPSKKKQIRKFLYYIKNNWDGIAQRHTQGVLGSCTEGLISHIYSERLSRNPMGWSDAGLNKMAELRVYTRNGCVVSGEAFKRSKEEKERSSLSDYANERLRKAVSGYFDWSIFEKEPYSPAVNSATQILIRSYGQQRNAG